MTIVALIYLVIGLFHANNKVNNPNPMLRPLWASDQSLPFLIRTAGFIGIALLWPLSMLTSKR
jgi:hypothetical protein